MNNKLSIQFLIGPILIVALLVVGLFILINRNASNDQVASEALHFSSETLDSVIVSEEAEGILNYRHEDIFDWAISFPGLPVEDYESVEDEDIGRFSLNEFIAPFEEDFYEVDVFRYFNDIVNSESDRFNVEIGLTSYFEGYIEYDDYEKKKFEVANWNEYIAFYYELYGEGDELVHGFLTMVVDGLYDLRYNGNVSDYDRNLERFKAFVNSFEIIK